MIFRKLLQIKFIVPPNHCTIFLHYNMINKPRIKKMSYHCDQIYSNNWSFHSKQNYQMEGTPTCIFILGGDHWICFVELKLCKSHATRRDSVLLKELIKYCWLRKISLYSYILKMKSLTTAKSRVVLVKWKHGVADHHDTNKLSLTLVIRTVTHVT